MYGRCVILCHRKKHHSCDKRIVSTLLLSKGIYLLPWSALAAFAGRTNETSGVDSTMSTTAWMSSGLVRCRPRPASAVAAFRSSLRHSPLAPPVSSSSSGGSAGAFSTESPQPEISKRKQFKQVRVCELTIPPELEILWRREKGERAPLLLLDQLRSACRPPFLQLLCTVRLILFNLEINGPLLLKTAVGDQPPSKVILIFGIDSVGRFARKNILRSSMQLCANPPAVIPFLLSYSYHTAIDHDRLLACHPESVLCEANTCLANTHKLSFAP